MSGSLVLTNDLFGITWSVEVGRLSRFGIVGLEKMKSASTELALPLMNDPLTTGTCSLKPLKQEKQYGRLLTPRQGSVELTKPFPKRSGRRLETTKWLSSSSVGRVGKW